MASSDGCKAVHIVQRGTAKKARILAKGGCSTDVMKHSSARQSKRGRSKDTCKTSYTSHSNEEEINADQCAICFWTYNDKLEKG